MICIDYVTQKSSGSEIAVTPEYISNIVDTYFSIVQNALQLNYTDNNKRDLAVQESIKKAKGQIQYQIDRAKEKQNEVDAIEMGTEVFENQIIKDNVIYIVSKIYNDLSKDRIEKCFDNVWENASKAVKNDEPRLTQKVIAKITKEHASRKIKTHKKDVEIIDQEFKEVLKTSVLNPNIGPNDELI